VPLFYSIKKTTKIMAPATSNTPSTLTTLVRDYVAYNAWANRTLVNWLRTKSVELFDKEVASSFPSLKQTLIHIWDTERFWLSVIRQVPPPPSFRFHAYDGTLQELMDSLVNESEELVSYVGSLPDALLEEKIQLSTPWFQANRSRFEYIHHTMNHSTYHRGQLITIGRNGGLTDAPLTDYNY
jgi:uncharacterized damage-inducible protein DinB